MAGYQAELGRIQQAMLNIRGMLGEEHRASAASLKPARREMSAVGRRRIVPAQKKRWADYNKRKAAGAKA